MTKTTRGRDSYFLYSTNISLTACKVKIEAVSIANKGQCNVSIAKELHFFYTPSEYPRLEQFPPIFISVNDGINILTEKRLFERIYRWSRFILGVL